VTVAPTRYTSPDEDSARWLAFPFREGDVVISTRSKCGTTWMQMICALLIHATPDLPQPLALLSPWLDALARPLDDVVRSLDAQLHRRVVKTHTPLDGLPLDPRATFIVVARHPLDMAVSLYHQGANIDRDRLAELTGSPVRQAGPHKPLHDWLVEWVRADDDPHDYLDCLPGVAWHYTDAWARRAAANVVLVHYDDLLRDLGGQMRRLAERLHMSVPPQQWPALVEAAGFPAMRARAAHLIPDAQGVLKDADAFFRQGTSGAGAAILTPVERAEYEARTAALAPQDVIWWLHGRASHSAGGTGGRPAPSTGQVTPAQGL
jgi:hypothetical protein